MGHKTKPSLVNRGKSYGGEVAGSGEKEEGESKEVSKYTEYRYEILWKSKIY